MWPGLIVPATNDSAYQQPLEVKQLMGQIKERKNISPPPGLEQG